MSIEITTRSDRGFHQYGEPVKTSYGDMIEVYESSSAEGPHVWLGVDGTKSGITTQQACDHVAHLSLEQAIAIRDRLTAFIDEVPARWGA